MGDGGYHRKIGQDDPTCCPSKSFTAWLLLFGLLVAPWMGCCLKLKYCFYAEIAGDGYSVVPGNCIRRELERCDRNCSASSGPENTGVERASSCSNFFFLRIFRARVMRDNMYLCIEIGLIRACRYGRILPLLLRSFALYGGKSWRDGVTVVINIVFI